MGGSPPVGSVPVGQRPALLVARSRWQLRREISRGSKLPGHSCGSHGTAISLAERLRTYRGLNRTRFFTRILHSLTLLLWLKTISERVRKESSTFGLSKELRHRQTRTNRVSSRDKRPHE